jgi:hypothetical protein
LTIEYALISPANIIVSATTKITTPSTALGRIGSGRGSVMTRSDAADLGVIRGLLAA